MSLQVLGFIEYIAQGGDTWDSIAIAAYNEERMSTLLIDANRDYIDTVIFEGGEVLKVPVIDAEQVETSETLPPWRR